MTALSDSYELVGRILAKLVLSGLRRCTIQASDFVEETTNENLQHFADVVAWLRTEGLINVGSSYVEVAYRGVQLTAKGIAAIEAGTFKGPEASIRATVEAKPDGGLGSDTYGKIGSFVGGLLGGFAQSAQ